MAWLLLVYDIRYIIQMKKGEKNIILIHIKELYFMYEIQYTAKIFIPCVFNRKKLMSLSPAGASCKQARGR